MKRWVGAHATRMGKIVRDTYGTVCWLCGKDIPDGQFSVDHVIPKSRGGDLFAIENLRPAHLRCNKIKGTRTISEVQSLPRPSRKW